eukprot:gb/GFBE01062061.1/.p1 GENE.gb/GFBE01062061.1/~~gb/GFBE01062061.1/.p1  ORF type:complete len:781 (+),score=94.71 gb/GFBE01062061.1/:1-2343(+)
MSSTSSGTTSSTFSVTWSSPTTTSSTVRQTSTVTLTTWTIATSTITTSRSTVTNMLPSTSSTAGSTRSSTAASMPTSNLSNPPNSGPDATADSFSTTSSAPRLMRNITQLLLTENRTALVSAARAELQLLAEGEDAAAWGALKTAATAFNGTESDATQTVRRQVTISSGVEVTVVLIRPSGNESALEVGTPAGAVVTVPLAVLAQAVADGEGVAALTIAALPSSASQLVAAVAAGSSGGSAGKLAPGPLSVNLYGADGNRLEGIELAAPMELTLQGTAEPGVRCVFWDADNSAWSERGVTRLDRGNASHPGPLVCQTTHLCIFAAIGAAVEATFMCSSASSIFSADSLAALGRGTWWYQLPAVMNWLAMALGVCLYYLAHRSDVQNADLLDCEVAESQMPAGAEREELVSASSTIRELFTKRTLSHVPEKVILWYARSIMEAHTGADYGIFRRVFRRSCHNKVHERARETAQAMFHGTWRLRMMLIFRAQNAWLAFRLPDSNASCKQRSIVQMARLYSAWAVTAVFYHSAGAQSSDSDCPFADVDLLSASWPELFAFMVRACVVGIVSLVVGALPVMFLVAVTRSKPQDRFRGVKAAAFWIFVTMFVTMCVLVIVFFLASVSTEDAEKWAVSGVFGAVQSLMIWPTVISLLVMAGFRWMRRRPQRWHTLLAEICPWLLSSQEDPVRPFQPRESLSSDGVAAVSSVRGKSLRESIQVEELEHEPEPSAPSRFSYVSIIGMPRRSRASAARASLSRSDWTWDAVLPNMVWRHDRDHTLDAMW